jgi:hypothetical protein
VDNHYDDDEDDELLAAWEAAEADAAQELREALDEHRNVPPPQPALTAAADAIREGLVTGRWPFSVIVELADLPADSKRLADLEDAELVIEVAGAWALGVGDPSEGLIEEHATVAALDIADWFGMVTGLVRAGPRTVVDGDALVEFIRACPEIDLGPDDDDEDDLVAAAFDVQVPVWAAAGVIDQDERLTALGAWVLPRMVCLMWGSSFDD